MDKMLYQILTDYYKSLSAVGYKKDSIVFKIIVIQFIHELFKKDLRYFITEEDRDLMRNILYNMFSTTCDFNFPLSEVLCCIDASPTSSFIP